MEGIIVVTKTNFKSFEKACKEEFKGKYYVVREDKLTYDILVLFGNIHDIFALGQAFFLQIALKHS